MSAWLGRLSFVVAMAAGASVGSQESAPRDGLAREIAWARASWPGELEGVRFHSQLAKLVGWVPRQRTLMVYAFSPDHACSPVTLSREVEPTAAGEYRPRLTGKVRVPGFAETLLTIDEYLMQEDDFRDGALSYVDDEVARFDGEPIEIHSDCNGPWAWLPCPGGGEYGCDHCEAIVVAATGRGGPWAHRSDPGKPFACKSSCNATPENAERERLARLLARVHPWRPRQAPLAEVPSLYRSRAACLREHPAGGR